MSAALQMSLPMILEATGSITSLPGSAAGPGLSPSPDGPTTDLFGQAVVPASPSAQPADKAALLTSGICGLGGFGSSASVSLTQSLANRLRERLASAGSIEFLQTWRRKDTPAGRRYWAHTASARRTSGRDFSGAGWPTPVGDDDNKSVEAHLAMKARMGGNRTAITSLQVMAQTAGWPTPRVSDEAAQRTLDGRGKRISPSGIYGANLSDLVQLAGWPTPTSVDRLRDEETLAKSAAFRKRNANQNTVPLYLGETAQLAAWPTPTKQDQIGSGARDWKDRSDPATWNCKEDRNRLDQLGRQASGLMPSGSPASTARRGALNPRFSLWLQGYPTGWASCGEAVTLSRPKSRPSS